MTMTTTRTRWGRARLAADGTCTGLTVRSPRHRGAELARSIVTSPDLPLGCCAAWLAALVGSVWLGARPLAYGAMLGLIVTVASRQLIEVLGRQVDCPLPAHTATRPDHIEALLAVLALASDRLDAGDLHRRLWVAAAAPEDAEQVLAEELDELRWREEVS